MTAMPQFGWINDPAAVGRVLEALRRQGHDPVFASAARHLMQLAGDQDVFFWELEKQVLGRVLDAWDQGQLGDCVGNGGGRTAQNCLLATIAAKIPADDGRPEAWPGAEVAVEPAYAGSREMSGISGFSDGSTGAGMAKWFVDYGVIVRGVYGRWDFIHYSTQTAKELGARAVPDDLKTVARQHPVKTVAVTQTADEVWAALGAWKPVCICGSISRTMKRQPGGWCPKTGNDWPHCQTLVGRCTVKGGQRAVVYLNSWGDYLGPDNNHVVLESGREVVLPMGCYLSRLEEIESDLQQGDTFAYSNAHGWPAQSFSWYL